MKPKHLKHPTEPDGVHSSSTSLSGFAPLLLLCIPVLLGTRVGAAEDLSIFDPREGNGVFVRASGKALFNVGVSVEKIRPTYGSGEYANGYVLPDVGGSSLTWNWGYDSDSQVDTLNDQLTFERYENLPPLSTQDETAIAPGGEIMAGIEFGTFQLGKRTVRYGMEVGFGFNYLSMDMGGSGSSMTTRTTAAHDLNGVTPPPEPYAGTFNGPGPLIGVAPTTTESVTAPSQASYSGQFEGGLQNYKIGVWFDYPINESFFTSLSVGYASIYADFQFTSTESLTYPNVTTTSTQGGRDIWNPGFYAQWRLGYQISDQFNAFLGIDYQWNGRASYSGDTWDITLDYSALLGASAGVQFNF